MSFELTEAKEVALEISNDQGDEKDLANAFAHVCNYIYDNPDRFSWRASSHKPSVETVSGLKILATKYFQAYRRSDFPATPNTKPDDIVSVVLAEAFGYAETDIHRIKREHQHAMSAENCVGALLERYIDSVLRPHDWYWCCGSFTKAVDFVSRDHDEKWVALQIKNRDNSENSSSSAIRGGTLIQKWFRSYSRSNETNWHSIPPRMQGYHLSEQGFRAYVRTYLNRKKPSH